MMWMIHAAASTEGSENITGVAGVHAGYEKAGGVVSRFAMPLPRSMLITGIHIISNVTIPFNWIPPSQTCATKFVKLVCSMQKQPNFSAGYRKQLLKGIWKGLFHKLLHSAIARVD